MPSVISGSTGEILLVDGYFNNVKGKELIDICSKYKSDQVHPGIKSVHLRKVECASALAFTGVRSFLKPIFEDAANRYYDENKIKLTGDVGYHYVCMDKGVVVDEHVDKEKIKVYNPSNPTFQKSEQDLRRWDAVAILFLEEDRKARVSLPRQKETFAPSPGSVLIFPVGYTHPYSIKASSKNELRFILTWFTSD